MKMTTKSAILVAAMAVLPAAQASADTVPGWYAGLGAGMNFERSTGDETTNVRSYRFNQPGFDAMANGGYAWNSGLRLEGEAFHGYSDVRSADGSLSNTALFANALYDINLGSMFTPYVGAGVGVDWVGANNIGLYAPAGGHINGEDTKLAYQGIAGVAAQLDGNWAVTADYRYTAALDPKFGDGAGYHAKIADASHNILFGVRYSFDTPAQVAPRMTQAPKPMPKPMAKTAVAPVPQTFQVFFDFNKADLTPEAKRIIASAAQEYKGGGYVRIVVTGHTDTKGTAKYNKALSDRRAASVKAEFASLGIPANVVVTQGVGKNGLLVPTNDQVREAQNRRAEIVLGKQ